ncbi:immune inhibitor A domain-containing protein [Bacillus sp. T3]|uniref:immune inhibitor A domain-containing protein n=1 Tax=Bacillus sp. T3 TaxID=467262 RepID=UPI002980CB07|nr:immune inhibitor A domain-containing protein [Bacillus sp. T3]
MKNVLKTSFASALLASTLFTGTTGTFASIEDGNLLHQSESNPQTTHSKTALDLAIVNDEKLIDSFIKRGLLSATASEKEKQTFLTNYLKVKGKVTENKESDPLAAKVKASDAVKDKNFKEYNNGLVNGKGQKNGQLKGTPTPIKEASYNGEKREDNVLVLTVEYSDFAHNQIKSTETDNYYKDYTLGHYENMIFGEDGVEGPNGEDFVSMKQYYLQQSRWYIFC